MLNASTGALRGKMGASDWVVLARLVRPQGRKGELLADLLTSVPERFADRRSVFLRAAPNTKAKASEPLPVEIEAHWLHKGRVVLKFSGVNSINEAEPLRGMDVVVPPEERAPLPADEVYIDDLLDCVVYEAIAGTHRKVGRITDVDTESTAGALLVVKREEGDEVLIPFVKAYLQRVDLAGKQIDMKLPEGLLEVNAPLSGQERSDFEPERSDLQPERSAFEPEQAGEDQAPSDE